MFQRAEIAGKPDVRQTTQKAVILSFDHEVASFYNTEIHHAYWCLRKGILL
jgi:hypothetical protein